MRIVRADHEGIEEAVRILKKGGVIVYPTETSYGIGADPLSRKAIEQVFKIKKRKSSKALTIVVSSLTMAKRYAKFDPMALHFAKRYWPGPLTIVLDSKAKKDQRIISALIATGGQEFGVRIPQNSFSRALIRAFGRPITSTSANISGEEACYSLKEILKQFERRKHQPDLVLDAGPLLRVPTSTVVRIVDGKIRIIRPGPIQPR